MPPPRRSSGARRGWSSGRSGCSELGFRGRGAVASELFTARALARFGGARVTVVPRGASAQALAPLPLQALDGRPGARVAGGLRAGHPGGGGPARADAGGRAARSAGAARTAARSRRGRHALSPRAGGGAGGGGAHARTGGRVARAAPLRTQGHGGWALRPASAGGAGRRCVSRSPSCSSRTVPERCRWPWRARATEPKLLLDLLRHRLEDVRLPAPVATLVLTVDESCEDRGQQRVLGALPEGDAGLESVLARLVTTLGPGALSSPRAAEEHRPEAARVPAPFRPPAAELGLYRRGAPHAHGPRCCGRSLAPPAERPVRLFPRARPAAGRPRTRPESCAVLGCSGAAAPSSGSPVRSGSAASGGRRRPSPATTTGCTSRGWGRPGCSATRVMASSICTGSSIDAGFGPSLAGRGRLSPSPCPPNAHALRLRRAPTPSGSRSTSGPTARRRSRPSSGASRGSRRDRGTTEAALSLQEIESIARDSGIDLALVRQARASSTRGRRRHRRGDRRRTAPPDHRAGGGRGIGAEHHERLAQEYPRGAVGPGRRSPLGAPREHLGAGPEPHRLRLHRDELGRGERGAPRREDAHPHRRRSLPARRAGSMEASSVESVAASGRTWAG